MRGSHPVTSLRSNHRTRRRACSCVGVTSKRTSAPREKRGLIFKLSVCNPERVAPAGGGRGRLSAEPRPPGLNVLEKPLLTCRLQTCWHMWTTHFWFRAADFQRNRNILKYTEYFRGSLFFPSMMFKDVFWQRKCLLFRTTLLVNLRVVKQKCLAVEIKNGIR